MTNTKNADADRGGFSRRRFLQGAGEVAAGGALLGAPVVALAQDPPRANGTRPGLKRYGADEQPIQLLVNGQARQVSVMPSTTLLEALRERMELTGAKEVCDRGACGACTVLVDGKSVNSCLMLAIDAVGRPITTVEGLAKDAQLDPVQKAFVECDACQCGYCIPGFVVRSRALLDETPNPTKDQIKEGLCGNICRCAAYVRIFEAVELAGKGARP
jgi:aerobic-type carbon monoxide dehydrogenase small subunit (CoxS/CutS family)